MREFWANVYGDEVGTPRTSRRAAAAIADLGHLTCRVHVRLKPKGAPRRYANAEHRRAWETKFWPDIMAYQKSVGL
jgi:hypothetical protein